MENKNQDVWDVQQIKYKCFLQAEVECQVIQALATAIPKETLDLGRKFPPWPGLCPVWNPDPKERRAEGILPPERRKKLSPDSSQVHWLYHRTLEVVITFYR